jgi:hypothetical protein
MGYAADAGVMTSARARAVDQAPAESRRQPRTTPTGHRRRSPAPTRMSPTDVLDLQREAGNHAVAGLLRTVQRVGGWKDADTRAGKGLAAGEPKTGWNVEEHAVGAIRRIPVDGLTQGLQSAVGADGGKSLTKEEVGGTVTGPARSESAEQKGRGRAIALIPSTLKPELPVDVLFHFHGNTENASRGFAGYRQHKASGAVRDVERDRIAQQIETSGNSQLVGILPMGVNQSSFGAISPDPYIRDAFDRLGELGAWKAVPQKFRVVLSAHSGGGFAIEKMMRGRAGFQMPQNVGMIVLFEANNNLKSLKKGEKQAFTTWALGQLNAHLAYLSGPASNAEKRTYLQQATRLRAFYDPREGHSYGDSIYVPLKDAIDGWFTADRRSALGPFLADMLSLFQIVKQSVGHEGQMRAGLGSALSALPPTPTTGGGRQPATGTPTKTGSSGGPTGTTGSTGTTATTGTTAAALSARASAITAAMVGGQAGAAAAVAMLTFAMSRGAGVPPLQAAAGALSSAGLKDRTDLTDALFALVRPEMAGARIPADRDDLKQEWLALRSSYARPALASAKGGATSEGAETAKKAPEKAPEKAEGTAAVEPAAGSPEEEYKSFSADVKKAFGKAGVKRYLAVRNLYSTRKETAGNPAQWLNQLQFGTQFAGTSLNGVHPNLLAALKKVDAEVTLLAAKVRAAEAPVVFQGDFQPRAVTGKPTKLSDHALGLALHLNYRNNPYIGRNKAASALIARIAEEAGQERFWKSIKGSGRKTTQARVEEIYLSFAAASDAVRKYFLEMDALDVKHQAGELDADGQAELKKRQKEYAQLRYSDLSMGKHAQRDPREGFFMHTTGVDGDPMLEIIKQLTGPAGLEWGGTYGGQAKDLHHFALKG